MIAASILLGAFVIIIINYVYNYITFWKHIYKIPGPKSVPILGNAFLKNLSPSETFLDDRKNARTFKNIFNTWGLNVAAVSFTNPSDIEQILTNNVQNKKSFIYDVLHSWLGTGLLTSYGTKWQNRRKILTPAFHFNILQEFVQIFNRETENLVEILKKNCHKDYIDVVEPITEFTLNSIAETSLGVNISEHSKKYELYKQAILNFGTILLSRTSSLWHFISLTYFFTPTKRLEDASIKILHSTSRSIIKERKNMIKNSQNQTYSAKKRLAMLDLLLKYKNEGALIDDEGIREEVDTFMFEGHDTTSMAICFSMMLLANHRQVQDKIVQEINEILGDKTKIPSFKELLDMKYLEICIKECLRLYPSVPFISRTAGESFTTTTGYYIPKGTTMNICIYDLHRRDDIYPSAENFDETRFLPENSDLRHNFAYIPFSAGSRNCIGQKYAILEIKAALCGILKNFILHPVDTPETLQMKTDIVLRPLQGIKIKFEPRK